MLQNQAYPHPTRPADPSALEMSIYNFELKAKAYHDQRLNNSTNKNDKELLNKMKRDYDHLQHEKDAFLHILFYKMIFKLIEMPVLNLLPKNYLMKNTILLKTSR